MDFTLDILMLYYEDGELGRYTTELYFLLSELKVSYPFLFMGWGGWLFWALLARFFTGIKHPPISGNPIGKGRIAIGIITFLIFILSFSWNGIFLA